MGFLDLLQGLRMPLMMKVQKKIMTTAMTMSMSTMTMIITTMTMIIPMTTSMVPIILPRVRAV